jgi:hypothetical protein
MDVPHSQERNEGKRQQSRNSRGLRRNHSNQSSENETTDISSKLIPGKQSLGSSNSQNNIQIREQEFQFIEVDQSGKPQSTKLKKLVHAHANARRHSTLNKKSPKHRSVPRKLLSKHVQSRPRAVLEAPGDLVLESGSTGSNILEGIPFKQVSFGFDVPREHRGAISGNVNLNKELVPFDRLSSSLEPNVTVAASRPIGRSVTPDFDRWQSRDGKSPLSSKQKCKSTCVSHEYLRVSYFLCSKYSLVHVHG